TAAEAAQIILEGVKCGRWRILVGEDAQRLDELVRQAPEDAYEAEFFAAFVAKAGWRVGRLSALRLGAAGAGLEQVNRVRGEETDDGEEEAEPAESQRQPGERQNAGYHRRRREHDADLEGSRGDLVVVIFRQRRVALLLHFLGSFRQLDGP